jgi:hypothetical protein
MSWYKDKSLEYLADRQIRHAQAKSNVRQAWNIAKFLALWGSMIAFCLAFWWAIYMAIWAFSGGAQSAGEQSAIPAPCQVNVQCEVTVPSWMQQK